MVTSSWASTSPAFSGLAQEAPAVSRRAPAVAQGNEARLITSAAEVVTTSEHKLLASAQLPAGPALVELRTRNTFSMRIVAPEEVDNDYRVG